MVRGGGVEGVGLRFPAGLRVSLAAFGCALLLGGCGGGTHGAGSFAPVPVTVSLPISTVVVMPSGTPVTVPVQIGSPSETAVVSVSGLPSGVSQRYASTDTNPSGTLTFAAADSTMTGTFMPVIHVLSANQSASKSFTLIVQKQ